MLIIVLVCLMIVSILAIGVFIMWPESSGKDKERNKPPGPTKTTPTKTGDDTKTTSKTSDDTNDKTIETGGDLKNELIALNTPMTKQQVDDMVASKTRYTVYVPGLTWDTLPFPEPGKGVTVPLQLGNLPTYNSSTKPRYYYKQVDPTFLTIARVQPVPPNVPVPLKIPPQEVLYLFSFQELGTRMLSTETRSEYLANKHDWTKYHDMLLYRGTTETTFQDVFNEIEPRVKSEMRGQHGIAKLVRAGPIRGSCVMIENDKIVKPNFKLYHSIPQEYYDSVYAWHVHPNGTPVFPLTFSYYKKPRANLGLNIMDNDLACDGFLAMSRRQRFKWDETYDYNQEWLLKGAITLDDLDDSMKDKVPDIKRIPF